MLVVFACDACPLAFQVGEVFYTDFGGYQENLVCYGCGTMHRLIEKKKTCRQFAVGGPMRDLAEVHAPDSAWRLIGAVEDVSKWRQLRCPTAMRSGDCGRGCD
ncbi:MAG: hypothetical protein U0793_29780 [Gemmataceae bacterium]